MKKNKKKKKGFTLIELLAVILILGIIALIAVPTVNAVIEQARKGAAKSSANQFLKAVDEYIVTNQLNGNEPLSGVYTVDELLDFGLSIKGDVPSDGVIYIYDNVVKDSLLNIDDYAISYSNGEYSVDDEVKEYDYGTMVYFNPTTGMKCDGKNVDSSVGNTSGCLRWYVLSNDGYMVNLILDHNIYNYLAWNSNGLNGSGPSSEFLNTLKSLTSSWSGIPTRDDSYTYTSSNISYTISYNGFKARIPSANEIARAIGNDTYDETTYTSELPFRENVDEHYVVDDSHWLYDYTYVCAYSGCKYSDNNTYGYWLSSARSDSYNHALAVEWDGCIRYYRTADVAVRDGIRPVITVLKSSIDQ